MAEPWELDWTGVKIEEPSGSTGTPGRVKPTADDMKELRGASSKAQTERDTMRDYTKVAKSVKDFGTGPFKASWMDLITPDQDDGILGTLGAYTIGAAARPFVSDKTLAARDHLNTVNAQVALSGSQQMKGSSSDKDTALMRMAGIGPYKTEAENNRIIKKAMVDGAREQVRSRFKSFWISKFGSLANPSPNGMTFEDGIANAERLFERNISGQKPTPRSAPPSTRNKAGGAGRPVYDLNGNQIR